MRKPWVLLAMAAVAAGAAACSAGTGVPADLPRDATHFAHAATRLAVIGDYGTGEQGELDVAAALAKEDQNEPLQALVTTGDNVYPSGEPKDFDRAWRGPYGWVAEADIRVLASLGNHDVDSSPANLRKLMELLGMPGRWYTERVGNVQVIVLDANEVGDDEQMAFITETLDAQRSAGARWRVVVFHQPAFSCSRHGSTPDVQREWVTLFERGGVDLVLNGHDHVYQRFAPIDGVTYVVTGGGGGSLYEMRDCPAGTPQPAAAAVETHYVVLHAATDRMLVEAVTSAGELIDSVVLEPRDPDAP